MAKIILKNIFSRKKTEDVKIDPEFEDLGIVLKSRIDRIFGRSLAIREVDSGSDNSQEIELTNLLAPHYDVERFGVSFVASPRHADVLVVTGPVTRNMEIALKKTYDAMPSPKFVIAVGDDACGIGIFKNSYAVVGEVEKVIPVDMKIPGNPASPKQIILGLLRLMEKIRRAK